MRCDGVVRQASSYPYWEIMVFSTSHYAVCQRVNKETNFIFCFLLEVTRNSVTALRRARFCSPGSVTTSRSLLRWVLAYCLRRAG